MLEKLKDSASKLLSSLDKEQEILHTLTRECRAAVKRMDSVKPGFKDFLEKAYAYAVFPSVGKAAAVLGGAFGKGQVFEQGKLIGYAAVGQLTLGVQIGGDTYIEVVVFESKPALERFKQGKTAFAANASAVLIKGAAAAAKDFEKGAAVYVHSDGGLMLEAAIGGQHFFFRSAVLGRYRPAPTAVDDSNRQKGRSARRHRPGKRHRKPSAKPHTTSKSASKRRRHHA